MISKNTSSSFYKIRTRNTFNKHQQTFDCLCEMKSIIGNKLASLYYLTNQNNMLASLPQLTKQNTTQAGRSFWEMAEKLA